jgi:hypothetical protein
MGDIDQYPEPIIDHRGPHLIDLTTDNTKMITSTQIIVKSNTTVL